LASESPQDCPAHSHFPPWVSHIYSQSLALGVNPALTSQVFDPIRSLMVEAKLLNWFDYKSTCLTITRPLLMSTQSMGCTNSSTRKLSSPRRHQSQSTFPRLNGKIERKQKPLFALTSLISPVRIPRGAWSMLTFLATIVFIHGPPGSGKTTLLDEILKTENRTTLFLDCAPLLDATSDQSIIDKLAKETGYWPVFSFVSSMNSLIDLASVGLIGQKGKEA